MDPEEVKVEGEEGTPEMETPMAEEETLPGEAEPVEDTDAPSDEATA